MANKIINTEGLQRLAQIISSDVSHVAIGLSTAAPTIGDTVLGNEHGRVTPSNRITAGRRFQIRGFFTNAELPTSTQGDVEEMGLFLNTGSTINTGKLLIHALQNFTPGNSDLLIMAEIEISRGST